MKTTLLENISSFEEEIGYSFKKKERILLALTHSSYKNELRLQYPDKKDELEDNERLEFLGDTILAFIVSKEMYNLFPECCEGQLSKYRSDLVSKTTLFKVAKKIKVARYLLMGRGESKANIKDKSSLLANSVESIIAAIYFDGGMKNAESFILKYFGPYIDKRKLSRLNQNFKSSLQEYTQKNLKTLPTYKTVARKNQFHSTAIATKSKTAVGWGNSKREAEQNAAQNLLRKLRAKKRAR